MKKHYFIVCRTKKYTWTAAWDNAYICQNCKEYWIETNSNPKPSKCDCGSSTLSKTHTSNGHRAKNIDSANWVSNGVSEMIFNNVIDQHPLSFQIECNEKYGKEEFDDNRKVRKSREEYLILNWKEITEEEYEEFKGQIG